VYLGIIDFLQDWGCAKSCAMCIKFAERNKSTMPPPFYARRFAKYFNEKFINDADCVDTLPVSLSNPTKKPGAGADGDTNSFEQVAAGAPVGRRKSLTTILQDLTATETTRKKNGGRLPGSAVRAVRNPLGRGSAPALSGPAGAEEQAGIFGQEPGPGVSQIAV
jgi:hypothetical protein